MTIEEKIDVIRGAAEPTAQSQGAAGYLTGVPRLGIPPVRFADGPPGVLTRVPAQAQAATMGVAATWSRSAAENNGVIIGRDARALGIDVVLQPSLDLDRDVSFARSYNTFGEDPFLAGELGAAEIHGVQSQGILAQARHFIGYDTDSSNVTIDPQTLHEVYLAPFAAAVRAGVASIMCSHNRINGQYACGNSATLQTILRNELGFTGFVTSDWGAVHNVRFVQRGLDMEMPGDLGPDSPPSPYTFFQTQSVDPMRKPPLPATDLDPGGLVELFRNTLPEEPPYTVHSYGLPRDVDHTDLAKALRDGTVTDVSITSASRHVLCALDRFRYLNGSRSRSVGARDVEANAKVIERTGLEAAVLLKNQDGALPLKSEDLASLALIGPNAGQVAAIGPPSERSPGLTQRQVGPFEALRKLAPGSHIALAVDDDMTGTPIPATVLSHHGLPGLERKVADSASIDPTLDFTAINQSALPPDSSVTWTGELTIAAAGNYWLYLQVEGGRGKLSVDGKELGRSGGALHADIQHPTYDNILPTTDGLDNVRRAVQLEKGAHSLSVQLTPDSSHAPAQIRLSWMTPEARIQAHAAAIQAAANARTAVVFVWTRGMPVYGLPGNQDELIDEVAAANPNTIVVMNTSQPVAMPWLDRVKGVLQMWWPGDEGGWATAKLLLGQANPSGHLPFTWAHRLADYPAADPSHPERSGRGVGGKTTFSEGVLIGYRWFDSQNIEPLFPFGFGMSYSRFELLGAKGRRTGDGTVVVSVRIHNGGRLGGDVVPQLYLDAPGPVPGIQFAPRTLVGFERVSLAAGETREIELQVSPRTFQYWSESAHRWETPDGPRVIRAGLSSRDLSVAVTVP